MKTFELLSWCASTALLMGTLAPADDVHRLEEELQLILSGEVCSRSRISSLAGRTRSGRHKRRIFVEHVL